MPVIASKTTGGRDDVGNHGVHDHAGGGADLRRGLFQRLDAARHQGIEAGTQDLVGLHAAHTTSTDVPIALINSLA